MTIRELIGGLTRYWLWLAVASAVPPVLSFVLGLLHVKGQGGRPPWKYLYAVLVYAVSFPGMLAAVLTGYALFFAKENLLDVNLAVYILPVLSMVLTLILIRRTVSFDEVPGFGRISGLLTMIGITFVLVLAINKMSIFLVFFGSIPMLIALVTGLFLLLKWGMAMAFRRKDEPETKPPSFPQLPSI